MLDWAMAHPAFKTQLFRFVDVFPATADDADVPAHLDEYFEGQRGPEALDLGLDVAEHVPFGKAVEASGRPPQHHPDGRAVHRRRRRRPRRSRGSHELWRQGSASTVDLLGEKTVVEAEADRYAARVDELLAALLRRAPPRGRPTTTSSATTSAPLPRVNVSIKPTALAAALRAAHPRARACARPRSGSARSCACARDRGATVHFDMEHYDVKDLTLELFRDLLGEAEFADLDAGIVIQAYLKDCRDDLADLIAWSAQRAQADHRAAGEGRLLGHRDGARAGRGLAGAGVRATRPRPTPTTSAAPACSTTTTARSGPPSAATTSARSPTPSPTAAASGIPDTRLRDPDALRHGRADARGHPPPRPAPARLRAGRRAGPGHGVPRAPAAREHVATSRFVRHRFAEGAALDEPDRAADGRTTSRARPRLAGAPPTDAADPAPYEPEPRARVAAARRPGPRFERGGRAGRPSRADRRPGGHRRRARCAPRRRSSRSTPRRSDRVVADARRRAAPPRPTPPSRPPGAGVAGVAARRRPASGPRVLFRAAAWMRDRRDELAALEVFEAGKPWAQADADVCEAIDFCEYYGREMLRLDAGGAVQSPPGEANRSRYQGKGVGVVIAPWNFPLAIPTGMTVAALVTGNPVVLKPAEQTPAIASRLVEALDGRRPARRACSTSCPASARRSAPAWSSTPTSRSSPSPARRPVGLAINEAAARAPARPAPRQAGDRRDGRQERRHRRRRRRPRPGGARRRSTRPSATPGQKCSAAVAADRPRRTSTTRSSPGWSRRAAELRVGHPAAHGHRRSARSSTPTPTAALTKAIEEAPAHGTVAHDPRRACPTAGWFVGPTVVADVDPARRSPPRRSSARCSPCSGPRDLDARHRARQRHRLRPHRRPLLPLAGAHPPGRGRAAGRQRLRQPGHHRRRGRPPALRRLRALRRRLEGRRPRLPAPVRRPPHRHREHAAPGLRTRGLGIREDG